MKRTWQHHPPILRSYQSMVFGVCRHRAVRSRVAEVSIRDKSEVDKRYTTVGTCNELHIHDMNAGHSCRTCRCEPFQRQTIVVVAVRGTRVLRRVWVAFAFFSFCASNATAPADTILLLHEQRGITKRHSLFPPRIGPFQRLYVQRRHKPNINVTHAAAGWKWLRNARGNFLPHLRVG